MAPNNSLAPKQNDKVGKLKFSEYLEKPEVKALIMKSVGNKPTRFTASVLSAISANPTLTDCSNASILSAALIGESYNLSPSPQLGQFFIVPYNDKKQGYIAQFQIGYKGYIQLAIRSGYYKNLNVLPIKEGELLYFNPITEEIQLCLIKDEAVREKAKTIGYFAMLEYLNGFKKTIYWSFDKMLIHADRYSKAFSKDGEIVKTQYGEKKRVSYADYLAKKYEERDAYLYSSFWYKDFDAMAMKTMLRQLISKWGIMSIEMQSAFEADDRGVPTDSAFSGFGGAGDREDAPDLPPETKTEEKAADPQPNADGQFDFFEGTDGGEQ